VLAELAALGEPALTVLAVAVASVPWLVAVGIVYLRRRPNEPTPAPPTLDLGPEPPAIANLLVHDFRVTRDAVPATLLDLSARGFVELEERGAGSYVCRLEEKDEPLTAYERRIVDHLRRRESGGIVPAQALTTGPSAESKRWWTDFQREVVADAQSRGLCLDILDGKTFKRLAIGALGPAAVLWAFTSFKAGVVYWVIAAFLLGVVKARHTQRDTPAGLAAASQWLGVRAKLADDEAFRSQPPIAVALWERHLAYGAAFGLATEAVRAIPMGAESDTRAWTSYGGRWRAVQITYPDTLPAGWGVHPAVALLHSLVWGAVSLFVLFVVAPNVFDVAPDAGAIELLIGALLVVLPAAAALVLALGFLRAAADLWSTRQVTGQILRLRTYGSDDKKRFYAAVDDGSSPKIRAWRVKPELYSTLQQGEVVTATITPYLRYVRSITPVETGASSLDRTAATSSAPSPAERT
jgi:Predicted membrane protein (DUF2207)